MEEQLNHSVNTFFSCKILKKTEFYNLAALVTALITVDVWPTCVIVWQYKYQINLDGTVAAYRLPYLLAGDAVVLKQDSQYYEFFYKQVSQKYI